MVRGRFPADDASTRHRGLRCYIVVPETLTEHKSSEHRWYDITLALLVGEIVFGAMVFYGLAVQIPEVSPPVQAAPLIIVPTATAAISSVLLLRNNVAGYVTAAITGLLAVIFLLSVGAGIVGTLKPETNPLGPLAYILLGVALFVSAMTAKRQRTT